VRVLFLTHRLPYTPNRGDRIRAYHVLRSLCTYAEVDLFSLVHDEEEAAHANDVRRQGARVTVERVRRGRNLLRAGAVVTSRVPLTHVMLDAPGVADAVRTLCESRQPDVVLAYCSGMARFAVEGPLAGRPFVLDLVDVDSQKWSDLARRTPPPLKWVYRRETRCLGAFEAMAATRAAATLVVNDREAALARVLAPGANVKVLSNGVDVASFRALAPPSAAPRVVFCGVMDYAPNDDAAVWLASEIWPTVRARHPGATLTLMGSNPTARLKSTCAADATIDITGCVADVRPTLWDSAVAIAPLRVARGLQNKVLEALAAGLPTVVTPAVAAGLPAVVLGGCAVADTAAALSMRLIELLALDPRQRRERAERADLERLSWATTLAPLRGILEAAVDGRPSSQPLSAR